MKNFVLLLATFLVVPTAFAVDVEIGGQHRTRGIYDQDRALDNIFVQRFKLNGAFRPNEMFESKFWLMTNYQWGEQSLAGNEVRFYGYGDWKMSDELMLRIGRTPYQIADGSTVGMNDYESYPYAFDGALLTYSTKSVGVDLWAAYLPNVWNGAAEEDKYEAAAGFSLDVRSLPEVVKLANLFAVVYSGTDSTNHVRFGVGVGGDVAGVDYRVNGVAHGDLSSNVVEQYAVDGQLGYAIDAADLRLYVGGHYESDAYDPFYYSRHYRSGLLDVAQWGNGTVYGEAGLSYLFKEDCEVGLAGYYFMTVGDWGALGSDGLNDENVIEADLYVKKSYAGGFSLELHGGLFDVANTSSLNWQANLNATFDF